jgi:hypothetical protein
MCKPGRPLGPRCLTHDFAYHVVVSYRANVQNLITSKLKGLTGGYPSQLFFYTLNEIVNEYTRDELRNLLSMPLKLSESEKALFLKHVLEQYWNYQGSYYFLSNNCATETLNTVKCLKDGKNDIQHAQANTPFGVLKQLLRRERLQSKGAADEGGTEFDLVDDRGHVLQPLLAERRGYYFSSKIAQLNAVFDDIKSFSVLTGQSGFPSREGFLKHTSADERLRIVQALLVSPSLSPDQKANVPLKMSILEEQIRRMNQKALLTRVAGSILDGKAEFREQAKSYFKLVQQFSPWNLADAGYGVPLPADVSAERKAELSASAEKIRELSAQIRTWAEQSVKDYSAEIKKCEDNLNIYRNIGQSYAIIPRWHY